jgi:hypothetical protein
MLLGMVVHQRPGKDSEVAFFKIRLIMDVASRQADGM